MRSTALVLRYSATECVSPVWGRSTHTNKMCLSYLGPPYTYQQYISVLSGAALHIPTRCVCPVWGRSTHTNQMCLSCQGPPYTYQQDISVLSGAALHIPTRCVCPVWGHYTHTNKMYPVLNMLHRLWVLSTVTSSIGRAPFS